MIEGELLLQAVRDRLRDNLTNVIGKRSLSANAHKKSIQITPDEKVPPSAGEEFINLFGSGFRNRNPAQSNSAIEVYGVTVGITRRILAQPVDRIGDSIYTEDVAVIDRIKPSMMKRAREIINLIDGVYSVITSVNTAAADVTGACGFYTALGLESADAQPKYVDENHFFTDPDSNKFHKGLYLEIVFSGAELLRVK